MSRLAIRNALQSAVADISGSISVAWENATFTPVNGIPYQKVNLLFAQPDNSEYGSNYTELGYLQITLMYPLLEGTIEIDERADLIKSAFQRGSSFTADGYTVVVDRTPEISGGARDTDRWSVTIKIRWHANVSI